MGEAAIRIGVGGWTFEPWRKGEFYPKGLSQKKELGYASEHLTSIEVNGTFYKTQSPETFQNWYDETPDGFVFALKAPRFATNRKALGTAGESVDRFMQSGILQLKEKLGPINWQMAPTKKFEAEDFEEFLKLLPREAGGRAIRHAVEVRHESFKCKEFVELARAYEVAVITAGDSAHPQIVDVTAPFVYVRIMGSKEEESNGYSDASLDLWAGRFKAWHSGEAPSDLEPLLAPPAAKVGRDVFAYAISGFKDRNPKAAMELIRRV